MVKHSLSDHLNLLNNQSTAHWALFEHHHKLYCLVKVMNEPRTVVREHLWLIKNVVEKAYGCNVSLLSELIQFKEEWAEFNKFAE